MSRMPIGIYMLFSYFAGAFTGIEKSHWIVYFFPMIPLVGLLLLELLWNLKPAQRRIQDYENNGGDEK